MRYVVLLLFIPNWFIADLSVWTPSSFLASSPVLVLLMMENYNFGNGLIDSKKAGYLEKREGEILNVIFINEKLRKLFNDLNDKTHEEYNRRFCYN